MGPLLLLFVFIAAPIVEIAVILKVGSWVGVLPTLGLIVATAAIGTLILRIQGLSTLAEARRQTAEGRPPLDPILHGVLLLLAGAFLLTPGFVTDTFGFLLLVPAIRRGIGRRVFGNIAIRVMGGGRGRGPHGPGGPKPRGPVIDGEFREQENSGSETPGRMPGPGHSPWER